MARKKVVITGSASGIGKATAIRFASEGFDVCMNDIQADKLTALLKDMPEGNHLILPGSYADESIITDAEKLIEQHWGSVDVLVSCAGMFEKTDPIEMELSQWRVIFDRMLTGSILMTRLVAKFMKLGG